MGLQLASLPAPAELETIAQRLEGQPADEIVRWATDTYGAGLVLACSFGGPTGMVALDLVMAAAPGTPVFYLDTGFLFPETYALVETVGRHYGITPRALRPALSPEEQAAQYGEALWQRDADACCAIRKVAPQRAFLRDYRAWITGLRRDQASTRRATPVVSWDEKSGLAKIAPLATWTEDEVWSYIYRHKLPYNPLHDQWYPSLGCVQCTRAILPGEEPRAGRWSGTGKIECGLHTRPAHAKQAVTA